MRARRDVSQRVRRRSLRNDLTNESLERQQLLSSSSSAAAAMASSMTSSRSSMHSSSMVSRVLPSSSLFLLGSLKHNSKPKKRREETCAILPPSVRPSVRLRPAITTAAAAELTNDRCGSGGRAGGRRAAEERVCERASAARSPKALRSLAECWSRDCWHEFYKGASRT